MSTGDNAGTNVQARRAQRKAVRTLGEIVADGSAEAMSCTVLDMSGSGARLKVDGAVRKAFSPTVNIPATFRLNISRDNISVDCQLAWRENDMIGVSFTSAFKSLKGQAKRA